MWKPFKKKTKILYKNSVDSAKSSDTITLVAAGTDVFGNISFSGSIHVEGRIVGDVMSETGTLYLAANGEIEGDIRASKVIINGTVRGNVYAMEQLELTSKAEVSGNVYYNLIEMGSGAQVNGHLKHTPGEELFPARPALTAVASKEETTPKVDQSIEDIIIAAK